MKFSLNSFPGNMSIDTVAVLIKKTKKLEREFRVYDQLNKNTFYGRNPNFLFFQVRYNRIHIQYLVKKHTVANEK